MCGCEGVVLCGCVGVMVWKCVGVWVWGCESHVFIVQTFSVSEPTCWSQTSANQRAVEPTNRNSPMAADSILTCKQTLSASRKNF